MAAPKKSSTPPLDITQYIYKKPGQGSAPSTDDRLTPQGLQYWLNYGMDNYFYPMRESGGSGGGGGGGGGRSGGGGGGGGLPAFSFDESPFLKERDKGIKTLNNIYRSLGRSIAKSPKEFRKIASTERSAIDANARQAAQDIVLSGAANDQERAQMRAALGIGDAAAVTNDSASKATSTTNSAIAAMLKDARRANADRLRINVDSSKSLAHIIGVDRKNQKKNISSFYDDMISQAREQAMAAYQKAAAKASRGGGGGGRGGYGSSSGMPTFGQMLQLAGMLNEEERNAYTGRYGPEDFLNGYNKAPSELSPGQRMQWSKALNRYVYG